MYHTGDLGHLSEEVKTTVRELLQTGLIMKVNGFYEPTALGQAIVAASLTPDDGLFVYDELARALQAFVMDGDMHVFYTFTPVTVAAVNINWVTFRNEMEKLDDSGIRALKLIGVKPGYVNTL